jgi:hypothetical protein
MNINRAYTLLSYLQKVAEVNPQVGKEVQLISSSIKNRIDKVKQKIDKPKDQNFNNSAGSSGTIPKFNNPQTSVSPQTNMAVSGPSSTPGNPQVQNFQSNFAPLNNQASPQGQTPPMFGQRTNLFGRG